MRPPVIAGLGPGAGATTLAAALHGVDGGRWTGGPVDVLVVGPGDDPTRAPGGVPVLVLRADGPAAAPPDAGAVVVLPEVPQWRGPGGPRTASGLLRLAPPERPAALRAAADALLAVTAALVGSGVLERAVAVPGRPVVAPPAPLPAPRVTPVLVHRAEPVAPRLVAGRPLRLSGPDPVPPPPVPPRDGAERARVRTLRLAPVAGPTVRPASGEPDDDALEGLSDQGLPDHVRGRWRAATRTG